MSIFLCALVNMFFLKPFNAIKCFFKSTYYFFRDEFINEFKITFSGLLEPFYVIFVALLFIFSPFGTMLIWRLNYKEIHLDKLLKLTMINFIISEIVATISLIVAYEYNFIPDESFFIIFMMFYSCVKLFTVIFAPIIYSFIKMIKKYFLVCYNECKEKEV